MDNIFITIFFAVMLSVILVGFAFILWEDHLVSMIGVVGIVVLFILLWVGTVTKCIDLYESSKELEKKREEQIEEDKQLMEDEKYIKENMESVTRLVEIEIKNVRLEDAGGETYRVHYVEMVEGLPVEKYRDVHKDQVYKIEEDGQRLTYRVLKDKERFSGWIRHSIWEEKVYVRVEDI